MKVLQSKTCEWKKKSKKNLCVFDHCETNPWNTAELWQKNNSHKQLSNPVMMCNFGVRDWLRLEGQQLDRMTRRKLTLGGVRHPRADVDRLYVKRRNGGRGLLELEAVCDQTMAGLADYLEQEYANVMKTVKMTDHSRNKYFIKKNTLIKSEQHIF